MLRRVGIHARTTFFVHVFDTKHAVMWRGRLF